MTRCPECGGYEIDVYQNGMNCRNCGLVLDDAPIERNPFVETSRISTGLNFGFSDTMPVSGKVVKHHWMKSTREKNLYKAKRKLELISSKVRLAPAVEKDAFLLFKSAVDRNLNLGRDNISLIYACVYASCLMHNLPKTPLEVVAFSGVETSKMLRSYRLIKKGLKLKFNLVDPSDLIHRFASRLELKQTTITYAIELIEQMKENNKTTGKQPKTIVASALYIASKLNGDSRTQREIANASGVIEVTIRKRSKEILELLN
jgi:transcription initiation factor TFIIIB Brf1 subunit/transcription initiation factor TFIIB